MGFPAKHPKAQPSMLTDASAREYSKTRAAAIWLFLRGDFPAALPHIHELAIGIAAYTCTCQLHCRIYMNLAAALPHIHELVSGIAAYTYTSSRVNVSSAATTVQVVALYSKVLLRKQLVARHLVVSLDTCDSCFCSSVLSQLEAEQRFTSCRTDIAVRVALPHCILLTQRIARF